MNLTLSKELGILTQTDHPYYFTFQLATISTITYLSTALLTSISPLSATIFTATAFALNRYTAPFFAEKLEDYRRVTLVPLAGQSMQLLSAATLAKLTCSLLKHSLTWKQIVRISVVFTINLALLNFALIKFRQSLQS
jgi:hypothetical protein